MSRTVSVKLRLEVGQYVAGAKQAESATGRIGDSLDKTAKRGKADMDKIASGLGRAGAALLALAGAAVYANLQFDKQMSEVGAVANATADQLNDLRDAAIEAGQATVFSASEAAQAEAELAKAGVSTADILGGALTGSLALAAAGSLDLATSATIAAAAMNTFGLKGDQVGHIADVLSAAANKSAAGVDDLGQGLQQVGLVANQVGLSLEETVALLGAFADRGLRGSDGATSLKTALQRLAAPTDEAAATMKSLGLSFYDANGQMKDIATVAGDLQAAFSKLSPAQRNAAAQTIFGSDAIRAANVLYSLGEKGVRDYTAAVDDQGAAARVAAAKMDNLAGDVEQLKGSLETLFITSGEGASGGLRTLAQGLTGIVNSLSALPAGVQSTTVIVAGLTGGLLLLASAGLKVRVRLIEMNAQLAATGPAGARAAAGLSAVTGAALKAGAALVALSLATDLVDGLDDTSISADGLADSLERLGKTSRISGELAAQFGSDLSDFGPAINSLNNPFAGLLGTFEKFVPGLKQMNRDLLNGSPTIYKERIEALDAALAQMVADGQTDAAAAAFKRLWTEAAKQGVSLDELQAAFPQYVTAAGKAAKATDTNAAAAKLGSIQNERLAGAYGKAASEANGLRNSIDELSGKFLTSIQAEDAAEQAIDDLADSFKENGKAMDAGTEAGRKNRESLVKVAETTRDAMQAKQNETSSVEDSLAVYQHYRDELIKTAIQAGYTRAEAEKLADQYLRIPSTVVTTIVTHHEDGYTTYREGERSTTGRRWGGVTTHAAAGALREAATFSTRSPARYAFAEPATGGEAFVPRNGNYGRSMSILHAAAGWYNADVVPRNGWYGGATQAAPAPVNIAVTLIDPITGAVTRRALITDALNRNKPAAAVASAYP